MSAVATVGLKTICLDLELDKNYATCLSSGTADIAILSDVAISADVAISICALIQQILLRSICGIYLKNT